MNWNQVKQQWAIVQEGVKSRWGKIDEADLMEINGRRDLFIRILAQKYGYAEGIARAKVDAFIGGLQPEGGSGTQQFWFSRLLRKGWRHFRVAGRH